MKVYFLQINAQDLQHLEDGRYVTPVIDLYLNDSYKNYSVAKSNYGFTPTRATWIGTRRIDTGGFLSWDEIRELNGDFDTDSGKVLGGRFIDTSGRIDIISFNVSENTGSVKLTAYHSDTIDDGFFREEWDHKGPVSTSHEVALIDSERYTKLVFDFGNEGGPSPLFLAYLRIEIDRTVMAPLYRSSRKMLDEFPEWMILSELPEEAATPEMATPSTVGGSFLNAIAGEWLDDIRRELSYRDFQKYISTVDTSQMAWAWRTSKLPQFVVSIQGDGIELARTANQEEFRAAINDDACYIDYENDVLYTTRKYNLLLINESSFDQEPHHMWNYLDEIGLFVDLPRLRLESNDEYQTRVTDVYKNRGGVGVEQLKLALRRELSLWKYFDIEQGYEITGATPGEAATPDSDYEFGFAEILDIEDLEAMNDPNDPRRYFDPDGMPTVRFVQLVERLSREHPTTWGRFSWGKAIWDSAGEDYAGYNVVPYRYDADMPDERYVQSGVGDGEDLFVFRPDVVTGPRDFGATVVARGKQKVLRTEYPKVEFDLRVRGIGMRDVYHHPIKTIALTLEVTTNDATPQTFVHSFTLATRSDVGPAEFAEAAPGTPKASDASIATYELFSEDNTTLPEVEFRDPTTNQLYEGTGIIPVENIAGIRLVQGKWEAGIYVNVETQNHFEVWLTNSPANVLTYNSSPLEFTLYSDSATPVLQDDVIGSAIAMRSIQLASATPTAWTSDEQLFHIELNGVAPFLSPVSLVFDDYRLDYILWDDYVTGRYLEFKIETINGDIEDIATPVDAVYGGLTRNEKNEEVFVPSGLISVNASTAWSSEGIMLLGATTQSVTIATGNGVQYPISFSVWEPFETSSLTTIQGVADENGPWRNGLPSSPGNTNFTLEVLDNLNRDDIVVPNTEDYIVTWIGVQTNNPRVLVWLDTNTVKPAITNGYMEYPEKNIEETIEEGTGLYYYSPITIFARIRPEPDAQWSPQIHSGYFYDKNDEYYFYADKVVEEVLTQDAVLAGVARQGAPVIVVTDAATPITLREVAFFDADATPSNLTTTNKEWVRGTGHPVLYASYRDIYGVVIEDKKGNVLIGDTAVDGNAIVTQVATNRDEHYLLTYRVRDSFCVDNTYTQGGEQFTRLIFDSPPNTKYIVSYESSIYDPATPVDVPLNPMYSMHNEGFIFISHNEYTLDSIRVRLSAPTILADGKDYILITIDSMDVNGNPKPEQAFQLTTSFGQLDKANVITDHDGFTVITLHSEESATPVTGGTLTITGGVTLSVDFEVQEPNWPEPSLSGVVKSEKIQADGISQNLVFGRLQNENEEPIANHSVIWHKRRGMYELFTPDDLDYTSLELDGEEGSYIHFINVSTSFNQNIQIEIDVHPYIWTGEPQTLVAQYAASGNQRAWQLRTDEVGGLVWSESVDGINYVDREIVQALPTHGRHHLRVTRTAATGLIQVFRKEGTEWILEAEATGFTGNLMASTANVSVGAISGGVTHQLSGKVYSVSVSHNTVLLINQSFGGAPWQVGDQNITRNDCVLNGGAKIIQGLSGQVTTSANGLFAIGPFTTSKTVEAGYWFMQLEATVAGTTIGDVVFWYEYPVSMMGVENVDGIPQLPVQMYTPVNAIPPYATTVKYPVSYDEQSADPAEQDPDIQWLPPEWYAISAWEQYQMGIASHKIHKAM